MLFSRKIWSLMILCFAFAMASCTTSGRQLQRFRITNTSPVAIEQAIVLFPNERLVFGPLGPHSTSPYQNVEQGVYRDASYEIMMNGQTLQLPVIDWSGEEALQGQTFTSYLTFDLQAAQYQQIHASVRASEE